MILILAVILLVVFRIKYHDDLVGLARTQVMNSTSDLINDAIDVQIEIGNIQYERMVYFEKDLDGRITALKTNMSEVNRLKTDILSIINDEILALCISAYQKRKLLSMEELWNLSIFLEIALIENIRNICEKIYSSQMQKYRAEDIIERLVEKKDTKTQVFKNAKREQGNSLINKEMKYPFIEYMSYKLKRYGKQGLPYLEVLEEQVNKMGMTVSEIIQKEHYDIAILKVSLGNSIISLKEILRVNFLSLFEQINGVEDILKKDPAEVYSKMDYKTKEYYRNEIKQISEKTKISELYIAKMAVELANKQENLGETNKKSHIGYYLISHGKKELLNSLGIKNKKHTSNIARAKRYIFINYFITIISSLLMGVFIYYAKNNIILSIITTLILFIPISEITQQLINYILNKKVKPTLIPKLDFSTRYSKKM